MIVVEFSDLQCPHCKNLAASLSAVQKALPEYGFEVQKAYLGYRPKNPVSLGDAERAEVEAFLQNLDEDDDVQDLYAALA